MSESVAERDGPGTGTRSARVLLDGSAGLPMHPAATAALAAALDLGWADPARLAHEGRQARALLDAARESVAGTLGARPDEVWFRPSGPDALAAAVRGLLAGRRRVGTRLVVSAVEHAAALDLARRHREDGGETLVVGVDRVGRVDLEAFGTAVRSPGPAAVAVLQAANHEVGTRQPVALAAAVCHEAGVPLVVDVQPVLGREAVPAAWDALAAHAPSFGGPPGLGVLALRTGTRWRPTAGDERAEPLPVPVPLAVAAAAALEAVEHDRAADVVRLRDLVDRIRREVPVSVPDVEMVGDPVDRLPHVVTFSCLYVDGEALLLELDRAGVVVGSGSACTSDALGPSHVLAAMGVLTQGNVRLALPPTASAADVDRLLGALPGAVRSVRERAGAVWP